MAKRKTLRGKTPNGGVKSTIDGGLEAGRDFGLFVGRGGFPLPFRRLPASHFPKAFRLPTVPLVVLPRPKPPPTPVPQTASPPQPTPAGPDTSVCRKMPTSHRRAASRFDLI